MKKNSNKIIKIIFALGIIIILVGIISLICFKTKKTINETKKFNYNDLNFTNQNTTENIKYGMSEEEIKSILYDPVEIYESTSEGQFGKIKTYIYDFAILEFYSFDDTEKQLLGSVTITSGDYSIRGIKIGENVKTIEKAFYKDGKNEKVSLLSNSGFDGTYLYGQYTNENFIEKNTKGNYQYAYINNSDTSADDLINYEYYDYHDIKWDKKGQYTKNYARLIFEINKETNEVRSISWKYYPN